MWPTFWPSVTVDDLVQTQASDVHVAYSLSMLNKLDDVHTLDGSKDSALVNK